MKANNHLSFADRLKALRVERGLTQKQLSEVTGIGYGTIVNYENRQREPNSKNMACLEEYFNVSGAYLRGETDDRDRLYWENPDIMEDLENIDTQLISRFLKYYRKAPEETKSYAYDVIAQLTNVLEKDDPDFQRRGTFIFHKFCDIAYDFVLDCKQTSELPPDKQHSLLGKQFFAITLIARCLEAVHKHYLPAHSIDALEVAVSPDEQST